MGLCCYNCKEEHYTPLTKIANWTYNYRMYLHEDFPLAWALKNNVEFVPMIARRKVPLTKKFKHCTMADPTG
jgi:hypothetical protein